MPKSISVKQGTSQNLGMSELFNQGGSLRTTVPKKAAKVLNLQQGDNMVWVALGNIAMLVPFEKVMNLESIIKDIKLHIE